jgi:hypothetical protein
MLECLDEIVVLKNTCEGASSANVLSLQALGITETFLASICGAEETPENLLNEIRSWARQYIYNDALTSHSKNLAPGGVLVNKRLGQPSDNDDTMTAPSGTKGGIVFDIDNPASNMVLTITEATFYGTATGSTTFRILDLFDGSEVGTFQLELAPGVGVKKALNIALPAYRERKRYLLTHDLLEFRELTIETNGCHSCAPYTHMLSGVTTYGGRIATNVSMRNSNIQRQTHTSGLSIVATLSCDRGQWLCENKSVVALPYLNLLGVGVMRAGIAQVERMNNSSTEEAKEMMEGRARDYSVEYKQTMENAMANMPLGTDPCFTCRTTTHVRTGLP